MIAATPSPMAAPLPASAPDFASLGIAARLDWAREAFGRTLVATTSFGVQSALLLHLLKTHAPDIPVVCVDTGYFFPETYQYADTLQQALGIEVRFYTSSVTPARMEHTLGRLWSLGEAEKARYALMRKVEPLDRALREHGARAWLSGLRRDQSDERRNRAFVEVQNRTTKIYPILDWTDAQVQAYFHDHQLPRHPLESRGFASVGDWHSTRKLEPGLRPEDTRANAFGRECGLHLESNSSDFQI